MGVDTRAYLPNVKKEQIKDFISSISSHTKLEDSGVDKNYKILLFVYKGESRQMNIHSVYYKKSDYIKNVMDRHNIDKEEAENWWKDDVLEVSKANNIPIGTNGNLVTIGYWGYNIEIMKMLCYRFGGYLDESDSDDEEYYRVEKNNKEIIKGVFGGV